MRFLVLAVLALSSAPAAAEVTHSSANGFVIRHTVDVAAPPARVMQSFANIQSWWNPQHTYSGSAANLSLVLKPGGCFCEALPNGGGVEHLRVAYVEPGKRAVLTGALGPLLFEAVAGVLDVRVEPAPNGSKLTFEYKAAGFAKSGADNIAPIVDRVVGEQVARLVAAAVKR